MNSKSMTYTNHVAGENAGLLRVDTKPANPRAIQARVCAGVAKNSRV
jgi:hypothetical protein